MNLVDRFLEYVKFDTQSDELTNLTPSTPGQMVFAEHLEKELHKLGLKDISLLTKKQLSLFLTIECFLIRLYLLFMKLNMVKQQDTLATIQVL